MPHDLSILEGIAACIEFLTLKPMKSGKPIDNLIALALIGFTAKVELGAITGRDDNRLINRIDLAQFSERALNHLRRKGNLFTQSDGRSRVINPD
jgi:hypothetical protein